MSDESTTVTIKGKGPIGALQYLLDAVSDTATEVVVNWTAHIDPPALVVPGDLAPVIDIGTARRIARRRVEESDALHRADDPARRIHDIQFHGEHDPTVSPW